jgi:type IV pilus assembly protein PilM
MTITGDGAALFMKQLPLGAGQLIETIQQRLDLTREDLRYAVQSEDGEEELAEQIIGALRLQLDALSLELSACLRYHAASRRSPGGVELVLCGTGAAIPGLARMLSDALDLVVHRPDPFTLPFTGVESNPRLSREFGAWSVPLGLALREVG